MFKYDAVVIGAGLSGVSFASRLADRYSRKVLILEIENEVGGNCKDYFHPNGVLVHKYGPHAFHTNSSSVWQFVNQHGNFNNYQHRVLAKISDTLMPVPFNFSSIDEFFPKIAAEAKTLLADFCGLSQSTTIVKLRNSESKVLRQIADFAFENIFRGYSEKQWGVPIQELSDSILARVPVRANYDDRYFTDKYQGLPIGGYTQLIRRVIESNANIHLSLNESMSLEEICLLANKCPVIFTGSLDSLFNYELGELEYRTLNFRIAETNLGDTITGVAQTNFPNTETYTRFTDYAQMTGIHGDRNVRVFEYPDKFVRDINHRFYPIVSDSARAIHVKYLNHLHDKHRNIFPLGRLAEYRYFNMDQAIASALSLAAQF